MAGRRVGILCVGFFLAVAAMMSTTTVAAAATSPVRIVTVRYDPPGIDRPVTGAKLNAEYVVIKNVSRTTQTLTGWTLRDAQHHVFTFPTFRLAAGKSVTVHTGKGAPSTTNRFYNNSNYIWNNTGDTATLRNARGSGVSSCAWTRLGTGSRNC